MRIAVSSDTDEPVARLVVDELRHRGHTVLAFGALRAGDRKDWAWSAEAAAREVAAGRTEQAVVCCWTGTGAALAANKVAGVRAALCGDAYTARGARIWNDANVLALSLRLTSGALLSEILDAWFDAVASGDADDRANVEHVDSLGVLDDAPVGERVR
ncbi:RpiB/LacA/LacB family sugar-phosphate isomerase [Streptomyces sp. SPB162]|uniref:RpiB/LacA/LacB family sugar-phosphate isomerase n=1 Tax=Streptomyces sp. SPB162 TaxID=2940560 RepID=UPI0024063FE1|nr:RpiB/LacA/LacB family sugar-phosphate isomerase [Streptomyces sp. SPB162]MDF9815392.1 RpiB/LacA/LacB family sugar-phosphate isomerase [Streptomyces sp. SPB162]